MLTGAVGRGVMQDFNLFLIFVTDNFVFNVLDVERKSHQMPWHIFNQLYQFLARKKYVAKETLEVLGWPTSCSKCVPETSDRS